MAGQGFVPVAQEVPLELIRDLRHQVLRGGNVKGEFAYPDDPAITHLAVLDDGLVVSCATAFPEPYEANSSAWRIRGMATDPRYQGRGCGKLLVAAILDKARDQGVGVVWCNARTSALGFYQSCGFDAIGPEFITDTGLPHRVAVYRVAD